MLVFHRREIDRLAAALTRGRGPFLLVGPAGAGKTTVARAVAAHPDVERTFGARRFWVSASAARTSGELLANIAATVSVPMGQTALAAIVQQLSKAPSLLTIDDLELFDPDELVTADELAGDLVRTPTVALLVTSRAVATGFSVRWRDIVRLGTVERGAARRAFLDIAGERFARDPAVEEVLHAFGYLPRAIERAAHLARTTSSLEPLLRDHSLHGPAQTTTGTGAAALRAIDTAEAHAALALLETFPNGLPDDAIRRTSDRTQAAVDTLCSLGLATREEERVRLRSVVPTRASTELGSVRTDADAIVSYYFELLARRAPDVGQSDTGGAALAALTVEASNIEQAIRLGLDQGSIDALRAADLFGSVIRFAGVSSLRLLERAAKAAQALGERSWQATLLARIGEIALARAEDDCARGAFAEAGHIYAEQGNRLGVARSLRGGAQAMLASNQWEEARTLFMEAFRASEVAGDQLGMALCTERLADISLVLSSASEAQDGYEAALALYRQLGHRRGEADCLHSMGEIALSTKTYDRAVELLTTAGDLHRQLGNLLGVANSQFRLGDVAFDRADRRAGSAADAGSHYEEALATYVQIGHIRGEANAVLRLGELDAELGREDAAAVQYDRALQLHRRAGDLLGQAGSIMRLADLEKVTGDTVGAHRAYREALALYRQLGDHESIASVSERLARIAETAQERQEYVACARAEWRAIGQMERIARLAEEFGSTDPLDPPISD